VGDNECPPAASGKALARRTDGADMGTAYAGPDGDRAAIVANNDLVSEVGW